MDLKEAIGIRIKEIRIKKKITQEQLAEKMDTNSKYISSVERGKENPTLNMLENFAKSLGVTVDDFFCLLQANDSANEKNLIISLIAKANNEQLKLAYKILSVIIE